MELEGPPRTPRCRCCGREARRGQLCKSCAEGQCESCRKMRLH